MKKILFTLVFGLFISLLSFGQSCGVDHTHHTTYDSPADKAWENHVKQVRYSLQARSNDTEMVELKVSFSQTQSLADQVGLTALMDYYTEMIDSVNAINQRSGLLVHWTIYEDNSLSVGPSTGDIGQVLTDITNENGPYTIINDRKRCKEIHVNVHIVNESYTPNGKVGIANQATKNGLPLHRANIVAKYKTSKKYFAYIIAHELGHLLGMAHEDSNNGAFDYSHAYLNMDVPFATTMWSTFVNANVMAPIYSSKDSLYQGYPTGDADHDNTATGNAVAPLIATYFDFDYAVQASQTTVCAGESVDLEIITDKGDDFDWSGQFLTPDGATAVFQSNTPGSYEVIGLTRNSSDGSCIWKADTISITVLEHETVDSTITIQTGETITLPDGTLLTDQDHGRTGIYTITGGAGNGCDLTVNWVVDVVSATIDVKDSDKVSIYPNPARDHVRVDIEGIEIETITAFDMVGRRISTIYAPLGSIELDVSTWVSGAYFLILYGKDAKIYRAKILID